MDADHLARRKQAGQDAQRRAVGRVVEGRREHHAVADVEVQIAGRQPRAVEVQGPRHRHRHHAQGAPAPAAHRGQAAEVVGQRRVVVVARVGLDRRRDRVRTHEPGHVVDVAVRVVAGDAPAQPQDPLDAQPLPQRAFEVAARQAGVARLPAAQQALLGGQQQALAVHVDAAALQDHPPRTAGGRRGDLETPHAEPFRDRPRQGVVPPPVAVAGPAVEAPVGRGDGARAARPADDEDRAAVPDPRAVGRRGVRVDSVRVDARPPQLPLRPPAHGRVAEDDRHALAAHEAAHDLGVAPFDSGGLDAPVGAGVGPDEPRRAVRLPLRGHPETVAGGGRERRRVRAGRRRTSNAHPAGGSPRGGSSR